MAHHRVVIVETIRKLRKVLRKHKVPFESWGQGATKTLEELWDEIRLGEAVLVETKKAKLIRHIKRTQCQIFYQDSDDRSLFLREERQVFANGHERTRDQSISVSEKLRKGERVRSGMARGISEELGITIADTKIFERIPGSLKKATHESGPYPGLHSKHVIILFRWQMPSEYYRPKGYTEVQPGRKTTYFTWIDRKE